MAAFQITWEIPLGCRWHEMAHSNETENCRRRLLILFNVQHRQNQGLPGHSDSSCLPVKERLTTYRRRLHCHSFVLHTSENNRLSSWLTINSRTTLIHREILAIPIPRNILPRTHPDFTPHPLHVVHEVGKSGCTSWPTNDSTM